MTLVDLPKTENRFLTEVSWTAYEKILEAVEDERRFRITFDEGQLELMTLSPEHEHIKTLLSQLVEQVLFEKGIEYHGAGSTTFRRKTLNKGLEPDECYWVKSFNAFGPDYDPAADPPPDLVLELEITQSCLNRMGIYQALGVSEVWRYNRRHELSVEVLGPQGYARAQSSPTLPELKLESLPEFVKLGLEKGNTAMARGFREWLKSF